MRRLLAVAVLGVSALAISPASAEPTCAYAGYFAVCGEYVCEEICGPEVHVDPQCSGLDEPVILAATCKAVDAM